MKPLGGVPAGSVQVVGRFASLRTWWALLTALLGFAALLPTAAWAHPSGLPELRARASVTFDNSDIWLVWDFHESIVIGIAVMIAAYAWAVTKGRVRYGWSSVPASRSQIQLFATSVVLLYLSLDGPLHHLADELLFCAHMLQHMLLQLIWAPILVLAIPEWLWRALYNLPGCKRFADFVTKPWMAFWLFNGVIVGWHIPWMYNLALTTHEFHILQHLMFMSTAVILWFVVIGPLPELRASYPRRMVFVVVNMFAMKALGLSLSMAEDIWYTFYASQPRAWGIDVMTDQQLGGLLMWMPGGGLLWFGLGKVFWQWVRQGTPDKGLTGVASIDAKRKLAGMTETRDPAMVRLGEG